MDQARAQGADNQVAVTARTVTSALDPAVATPAESSILALQRSAGNRAVTGLISGDRPDHAVRLQRQDTAPGSGDPWLPPPIQWPTEAQGEPNQPCFGPDSQLQIATGIGQADAALAKLRAGPPDLDAAVAAMGAAVSSWEQAAGDEPGQATLNGARERMSGAWERVMIYVEPVATMLEQLSTGAQVASTDAQAASVMVEPADSAPAEEEGYAAPPAPCFDDAQQAIIGEGVELAGQARAEVDRRPPDYRKLLRLLNDAATRLESVGGSEPGQAKLKGAVGMLDRLAGVVDAYLTPVADVVMQAAASVAEAKQLAQDAATAAKPGPFAPGGEGERAGQAGPSGYAPPGGWPPSGDAPPPSEAPPSGYAPPPEERTRGYAPP